jgi:hypothetical protein
MENKQENNHSQAQAEAAAILQAYREAYAPAQHTLRERVDAFYASFIAPVAQTIKDGRWEDFRRHWPSRALKVPERILNDALDTHIAMETSAEVASLQGRSMGHKERRGRLEFDVYARNLRQLLALALKAARRSLGRKRPKPSSSAPSVLRSPAASDSEEKADRTSGDEDGDSSESRTSSRSRSPSPLLQTSGAKRKHTEPEPESDLGYDAAVAAAADDADAHAADAHAAAALASGAGGGSPHVGYGDGKRTRLASAASEHPHSSKRGRAGSSPPPAAAEQEADAAPPPAGRGAADGGNPVLGSENGDAAAHEAFLQEADAAPSPGRRCAASGDSPDFGGSDFGGSDFGYENGDVAADDAFWQEADAAPSPGRRCAASGGSPDFGGSDFGGSDFGYENGDAAADDAFWQEAVRVRVDGDPSTTPKSKPKRRVAKPSMAAPSPSSPPPSGSRARSRSSSEYAAELQAAQTAYDAAEAKYRACPTSTTCEQRTLAGRREELCGTDAFAAAESFLANPGSLEEVWERVKAEVPARAARLAIYHAVRELGAGESKRAKGFLIEALFRHLLYGRQDLLEEWNFLEKAADADAAWRAGGLQSQVAALLVGTGGMSELLACAEPTDVLQYVCLEGSARAADILAGSVPASLVWKECTVSDHARVFGHAVTDPARSYDIAYTVSQGQHLKSVVSLRAGTPLTWYGVTARHGRQNTPPQSNMTPTRRGDLTHQHIAWGSGGVSLDGRYCKPTDALAGGGAFANNPPPGTAASLDSLLYAVRRGGTSQIVPVLVMATKVDVKARDELTYQYTACFDAEPTLLAMRSCADLPRYLLLMPHLDPGALFGSYAGFWQHLLAYEGRKRQLAEAKDARDKAKEKLEALLAAAEE